jgi:molybdopterin molybdotransferase
MPELFDVHTPPDAWRTFSAAFRPAVRNEHIAVIDALGRVLAADLVAPHDLPGFPRSTVDGYAVAAQDTHGASDSLPAYLEVVGEVPMGRPAHVDLDEGQCAIVHTGGMIPADADAVVMVEHTQKVRGSEGQKDSAVSVQSPNPSGTVPSHPITQSLRDGSQSPSFLPYTIEVYRPVAVGQNVIQVGEDVRQGEAVLPASHVLRPQDIGGLLALGITEVDVAVRPRVAILSQGDEVVPPDQEPGPGQVRDINSHTLAALARQAGAEALTFPIVPDRLEALQAAAASALAQADMLVMSAGSSVSVRDMTAQVIDGLGKPGILVHGVSVKPGKPTILAVCDGKPVFGLPGNPVSAMVIFEMFVTPAIRSLLGAEEARKTRVPARLARNIASATGREDIVQVRLEARPISSAPGTELWAVPVLGKSNLIYTLIRAEGAVRVPLDSNGIAQGEWVMVELY